MKKLKYAVILLLGLSMVMIMTSCNKEEDVSSYKDKIVGEWQMTKEYYCRYDPTGAIDDESEYYVPNDEEMGKWKFFSEGMVRMSNDWWHKSNSELSEFYNVPYIIDESTLYIGDGSDEFTYTIKELTNSTMVLEQEYYYSDGSRSVGRYEFKKGWSNNGYAINVYKSPDKCGSVTGNGFYQQGETCTLKAVANNGYTFLKWTENGITVSTDASYSFTVSSDRILTAVFDGGDSTPSISVYQADGCINDGDVINLYESYQFGFVVSLQYAWLSSLEIRIDDVEYDYVELDDWVNWAGTYTYRGNVEYNTIEGLFEHEITAVVTDEEGRTNSASIHFYLNQESPLHVTGFMWYRTQTGHGVGLEKYGLDWPENHNGKAKIKPLDGVTLYRFNSSAWDATNTYNGKLVLFANDGQIIDEYNNVSTWDNATYDDVIGTKMPDGTLHLIHVTAFTIETISYGSRIYYIDGESK
ncbi:MAG: lipocalin family protein [Bacteroidales bacterium]|nr:lipocalin family protein [Bacteroidales bacterium]